MRTIELNGIIETEYNDWGKIKLIQEDGFKIDLVSRFREAFESFGENGVQVSYYLADKKCTKTEILEEHLKKIFGAIEADYETNSYRYSSWTSGTDYDTVLKIGGHDLYSELRFEDGKYLLLEMNFNIENL